MYALTAVSLIVVAGSAVGQTLPYAPGARVRFATEPGARWLYANVIEASRRDVLVLPQGDQDTRLLRFNEQLRLQIYEGRSLTTTALGGGIGLSLGVLAGATVLSDVIGTQGAGKSRAQSAVVFGLVGTFAGALIASRIGPETWDDVPVASGFFAPAPLVVDDPPQRSIRKQVHRWDRFAPTEEDFLTFFEQYRNHLDPIEGLWVRWGGNLLDRVAIVRDGSFEGWEYVIVRVPSGPRSSVRTNGLILEVLRRGEKPGEFLRAIPGSHPGVLPVPYEVVDGRIWNPREARPVYDRRFPG